MKYSEYRDNIKTGDLLVWSARRLDGISDIIPWIVRFFTVSDYNHVGIAWWFSGRLFVIEATMPEIRIQPLSKRTPFYHIPMNVEVDDRGLEFLMDKVGIKYSVIQAIAAYFGTDLKDRWICTKLTREFYRLYGIDLGNDLKPTDHIRNVLKKLNTSITLVDR